MEIGTPIKHKNSPRTGRIIDKQTSNFSGRVKYLVKWNFEYKGKLLSSIQWVKPDKIEIYIPPPKPTTWQKLKKKIATLIKP